MKRFSRSAGAASTSKQTDLLLETYLNISKDTYLTF